MPQLRALIYNKMETKEFVGAVRKEMLVRKALVELERGRDRAEHEAQAPVATAHVATAPARRDVIAENDDYVALSRCYSAR